MIALKSVFIFQLLLVFILLGPQISFCSGGCVNVRELFRKKIKENTSNSDRRRWFENKRDKKLYSKSVKIKHKVLNKELDKRGMNCFIYLVANRLSIFEESYVSIHKTAISKWRTCRNLFTRFTEENGAGRGVNKEYFHLLSKTAVNPDFGLFKYTSDDYMLEINPLSGERHSIHLSYFRFIGIVAGLAVKHGVLLNANLPLSFFKTMLGKPVVLKDMEDVDPQYYKSLLYIEKNNAQNLDLTFCVSDDTIGSHKLKPGGEYISVTEQNKVEFINLIIQWRLVTRIQQQMSSFTNGFIDIIEQRFIQPFDEHELRILMFGTNVIDIKDWETNTEYNGYSKNSDTVRLFWKVVSSYDDENRSKLLQFVTGSERLPVNGFRYLKRKFKITRMDNPNSYPQAAICHNELMLPPYKSYDTMQEKLNFALEHMEGMYGD